MPTREEVDTIQTAIDRAAELLCEVIAAKKSRDEISEQMALDALGRCLVEVKVALRVVRPDK